MSSQENATLARQMYRWFNESQYDEVVGCAVENVEVVLVPFGQTFRGHPGFREFLTSFKTAVPDMKLEVTNQVATDDQVVSEFVVRGTHTGPLQTPAGAVPATGKSIEYPVCEVWGIKQGKLASIRNYFDSATLLRQLGLIG
jgi:steroid delta-isomerase-like uncharacterized protein